MAETPSPRQGMQLSRLDTRILYNATTRPHYEPAYGAQAQRILNSTYQVLTSHTDRFVDSFYRPLSDCQASSAILDDLSEPEYLALKDAQRNHLTKIVSPSLTIESHLADICAMAHAHEMVGVELPTLLEAYHLYQTSINDIINTINLSSADISTLISIIELRLKLDLEGQIMSHNHMEQQASLFIERFDQVLVKAENLADLLAEITQSLVCMEGVIGSLFLRPDSSGYLQIESAGGEYGKAYANAMYNGDIPLMQIDASKAGGKGPAGAAWRSGRIETLSNFKVIPDCAPWMQFAQELRFRSCVALPLLDEIGRPFALLTLYSNWPRFFSTPGRQILLRHIQHTTSHAVVHYERSMIMPVNARTDYCKLLDGGMVQFLYQPIVDLKTGDLQCVELLARLRRGDETLVSPGQFLPAFGTRDLLTLFKLGIECVGKDLKRWKKAGFACPISVNLPPEGLVDDLYREILILAVQQGTLRPKMLRLEILETQDPADTQKRDNKLSELQKLGFTVVQDDLGSGYSSLLRMKRMKFDAVKIDQGLVRSAKHNPQIALDFILHLTKLAHAFGVHVTVEGIENKGLIEASCILGADSGQGYGIARPLPSDDVVHWNTSRTRITCAYSPRTAIGALAGYLLWDQQLSTLSQWPDLTEQFIRAPCLVQQYLETALIDAPKVRTRLQALLDNNHACALRGSSGKMYQRTKRRLIHEIARHWTDSQGT